MALLGVDLVLAALGLAGLGDPAPESVYPAAHLVGRWLAAPFALAALVTGLGVLLAGPFSLRSDRWVLAKLTVTAALLINVILGRYEPWLSPARR